MLPAVSQLAGPDNPLRTRRTDRLAPSSEPKRQFPGLSDQGCYRKCAIGSPNPLAVRCAALRASRISDAVESKVRATGLPSLGALGPGPCRPPPDRWPCLTRRSACSPCVDYQPAAATRAGPEGTARKRLPCTSIQEMAAQHNLHGPARHPRCAFLQVQHGHTAVIRRAWLPAQYWPEAVDDCLHGACRDSPRFRIEPPKRSATAQVANGDGVHPRWTSQDGRSGSVPRRGIGPLYVPLKTGKAGADRRWSVCRTVIRHPVAAPVCFSACSPPNVRTPPATPALFVYEHGKNRFTKVVEVRRPVHQPA
jgi:hypothetical protein